MNSAAGRIAGTGRAEVKCFPSALALASITDPWPQRLLLSCECPVLPCPVLPAGSSACLWHGGSTLAGALWLLAEANQSARHNAPHWRWIERTEMRMPQRIFMTDKRRE